MTSALLTLGFPTPSPMTLGPSTPALPLPCLYLKRNLGDLVDYNIVSYFLSIKEWCLIPASCLALIFPFVLSFHPPLFMSSGGGGSDNGGGV